MVKRSSTPSRSKTLIETDAIIVAYAMSRLDATFLKRFGYRSWRAAFASTGSQLAVAPASMKNLRDEFDPVHLNSRKGWHKRALRPNRQRVLGELCDTSDEAMIEIVSRLLSRDHEVQELISRPLAETHTRAQNVAERLRTGRLAEEFFLANSERVCGIPARRLVDVRAEARGFDFAVSGSSALAIEVKGLKALRGDVLFTDHEWDQASRRTNDYWLVVVGSIEKAPQARVIKHPAGILKAVSTLRQTAEMTWRARVAVA